MKIDFTRSGGFAGIVLPLHIDTDELMLSEAEALIHHVEAALPAIRKAPRSATRADRFTYALTIQRDLSRAESHTLGEADIPPQARPLLQILTRLALQRRAGTIPPRS